MTEFLRPGGGMDAIVFIVICFGVPWILERGRKKRAAAEAKYYEYWLAKETTWHGRLATYDFDGLTRAVVMAHDRCIRFEVGPSGPGMVRLMVHKRHSRDGNMYERHPTLEEHVAEIRGE